VTTYRLFPATSGPASIAGSANPIVVGVVFAVKGGTAKWFRGYWWWVTATGMASTVKCALWSASPTAHGGSGDIVVPGSVVTSGALAPGWNFIPLSSPIQLAPSLDPGNSTTGSAYIAAIAPDGGFAATTSQFNSGDPYSGGIVSGPLAAYSGTTGSLPAPYSLGQGLYTTAGGDPSTSMPNQTDSSGDHATNFWVDVELDDENAGYAGSFRGLPGKGDANGSTGSDADVPYVGAVEGDLDVPCESNFVHCFVPNNASAAAGLPTAVGVWDIATQALVASIMSPSWTTESGGAVTIGTYGQWIKAAFDPGVIVAAGSYRIGVYNSNGAAGSWLAKDATTSYWSAGVGSNGITNGPLTFPDQSSAQPAAYYPGSGTGAAGGQPVFAYSGSFVFPDFTTGLNPAQNYWIDWEVTPVPSYSGTGDAAITLAATGTGTGHHAGTGSGALSLTASGAGSSARHGTSDAAVTLDATAAGTSARAGTGIAAVALAATATGVPHKAGTGVAMLALAGLGTVPPPPKPVGSWWGLDTILKESRQEFDAYWDRPPLDCPVCGQPLVNAPSTPAGSGVELYCNYAGDHQYHWPRDRDVPVRMDSGSSGGWS